MSEPGDTPDPKTPKDAPQQADDGHTRIAPQSPGGQNPTPDDDQTRFSPPHPAAPGGTAAPQKGTDPGSIAPLPTPRNAATNTETTPGVQTTAIGIGTLVNNNYEIREVLKSGGMGEVYRGVEIGTGDPVAIKAILPELAEDEKAGLLFKREARTLRQLADEAIVRYYNYVHDRDLDRYFLVMEFLEGVPLSDHMQAHGPLPVPQVFILLKRLSKGLDKAHAQDVIHRDLSPDNVMLAGGDVSEARLIDFGIAKSNVVKEGTMHGQFAGKFKYVAPEQLGHHGGVITPMTDVYGLALLAAAASMGKALDMGGSIVEAVKAREQIPDLSGVPEPLRPLLSHMLEPEPTHRPASMEVVRQMLEKPNLIPAKYRAGLPPPPPMDMTGRGTLSPATPPPGLQMPMIGGTTTAAPLPSTTQTTSQPMPLSGPEETGGGGALKLLFAAFVVVSAGVGIIAWQSGMLGSPQTADNAGPLPGQSSQMEGIPAPQSGTRAGFLAGFDAGECTYLARVSAGQNAGMIEGYSTTGNAFPGLPVAYEEQFGARPAILPREITVQQCAALEFARAVQGRGREAPQMLFPADRITSGEAIRARISGTVGLAVWTALITPAGGVFNLTERVSEPVGGERSLSFGLNLNEGAEAVPQLVLLVTSDSPLTRAATAADGSSAAELLPLVLEEIAGRGGAASASLGYVLLEPLEPEPGTEPEDPATETAE